MKEKTFIDLWRNDGGSKELTNFHKVLFANKFEDGVISAEFASSLEDEVSSAEKLKIIEKDSFFKLIAKNHDFSKAYKFLQSAKAPKEYKSSISKINFLQCLYFSLVLHSTILSASSPSKSSINKEKKKKIVWKKVEALIKAIDDAGYDLTYEDAQPLLQGLDLLYRPIKGSKKDTTLERRTFLYDLVKRLRVKELPRSPTLIGYCLDMLGEESDNTDKWNLTKLIQKTENECIKDMKRFEARSSLLTPPSDE